MSSIRDEIDPALGFIHQANAYTDSLIERLHPLIERMVLCEMKIRELRKRPDYKVQHGSQLEGLRADQDFERGEISRILWSHIILEE